MDRFVEADRDNVARKLGYSVCTDADVETMQALQALLQVAEVDMTLWFRALGRFDPRGDVASQLEGPAALFDAAWYDEAKRAQAAPAFIEWLQRHAARLRDDPAAPAERRTRMDSANPKYVLRNYLAQEVIDRAEQGDETGIAELLDVMRRPYDEQPGRERFAERRPDWARDRAGCSMLSCSS